MGQPLNQILYGPPGTGKTYNTIYKALDILEPGKVYKDRKEAKTTFDEYVASGRIVFTTFHQSMSYEDFVEGIKPALASNSISYDIEDGIFKKMCKKAYNCYIQDNAAYSHSSKVIAANMLITKEDIAKGYDDLVAEVRNENGKKQIPLPKSNSMSQPMILTSNDIIQFKKKDGNPGDRSSKETIIIFFEEEQDYVKAHTHEYKKKGNNTNHIAVLFYIWEKILADRESSSNTVIEDIPNLHKYVLIIDEINRGNVANIFGELITLIEDDKRLGEAEKTTVTLPYSKEKFGVPNNLYIIGTMNTADRSVEALDSALRRRFTFEEMMPDPSKLSKDVYGVDLEKLLTTINARIEVLKDREHQIGHSYFIGIKSKREIVDVIQKKVVPLLQEYFYGDYEKIMQVVGDGFVTKVETKDISFAVGNNSVDKPDAIYRIVKEITDIDSALEKIKFGFEKSEVAQSDGE